MIKFIYKKTGKKVSNKNVFSSVANPDPFHFCLPDPGSKELSKNHFKKTQRNKPKKKGKEP